MMKEKQLEYITLYEKYNSLYSFMLEHRREYIMLTDMHYNNKLDYYKKMADIYKDKAGTCRKYIIKGNLKYNMRYY